METWADMQRAENGEPPDNSLDGQWMADVYDDLGDPEEARELIAETSARLNRDSGGINCDYCGGQFTAFRSGACYTCRRCGETTGCG